MSLVLKYPLDLTGQSVINRIEDEPHTLSNNDNRSLVPHNVPFYSESFTITDTDSGQQLEEGVHYELVLYYEEPSIKAGKEVMGGVVITDPTVSSNVTVTYQTVGGDYYQIRGIITQLFDELNIDNRTIEWGDLFGKPSFYPPKEHLHGLRDVYGFEYVVDQLQKINEAIVQGNVTRAIELEDLIEDRFDTAINQINTVSDDIKVTRTGYETATQGQDTFTIEDGYVVGAIAVYLNGVRITQFTADDSSTVVLDHPANDGDIFAWEAYGTEATTLLGNNDRNALRTRLHRSMTAIGDHYQSSHYDFQRQVFGVGTPHNGIEEVFDFNTQFTYSSGLSRWGWIFNDEGDILYDEFLPDVARVSVIDIATGRPLGLQSEKETTNINAVSEGLANSTWWSHVHNVNVEDADAIANLPTQKIVPDDTNGFHRLATSESLTNGSISYPNAKDHSLSFIAKDEGYYWLTVGLYESSDQWIAAKIDLRDGTMTTAVRGDGSITQTRVREIGERTYYITLIGTPTSTTGNGIDLLWACHPDEPNLDNTGDLYEDDSFAGDGTSGIAITAIQLESSPVPTSYIQTYGQPKSRDADDVSSTLPTRYQNGFVGVWRATLPFDVNNRSHLATFSDDSTNNIIAIYVNSAMELHVRIVVGGTEEIDLTIANVTAGDPIHIVLACDAQRCRVSLDNSAIVEQVLSNYPTPLTKQHIGRDVNDGREWNGTIAQQLLFATPQFWSNSQLENLNIT